MKYKKSIKYKVFSIKYVLWVFYLIILTTYFLILNTSNANAQGVSLRVSPSSLQIKALAPTEITAPIKLENPGDDPIDLKIEFKEFRPSDKANGEIEFLGHNSSTIFSKIQLTEAGISTNQLSLGPKQKKDLTLRITLTPEEKTRDHYFSVVFVSSQPQSQLTESEAGQHSVTRINAGVAMNVLLSVTSSTPEETPPQPGNVTIEEFTAPSFVEKGPVSFNVKLQNKTSNYINPKSTIYVKNMFGQLIGKIDLQQSNILANSSRYLSTQNQPSSSLSEVEGHSPTALWLESFLLGFYTAELRVEVEPDAPPLTKTIRFTAIPTQLLLSVTFAVIFSLMVYRRVKQRMRDR
jgi:hypothetical protein